MKRDWQRITKPRRGLLSCSLAALVLLLTACVQVPDVERGLRSLHFESNTYIAEAGDTVESIAYRYRMSQQQLLALNGHIGDRVVPGDRVVINRYTGPENDPEAYTGQGWYRDPVLASRHDRSLSRVPVTEATTHATHEQPVERIDISRQRLPDDAVLAEIQANYQPPEPFEEIIPEDELDILAGTGDETVLHRPVEVDTGRQLSSGPGWSWPMPGEVVRDYAPGEVNGQGLDIAGSPGQHVAAAANGTVIYTGRDLSNSGNLVIIRHADGLLSTYSHTKDLFVTEEEFVQAGDTIASLGWNSNRESVLHFEVRRDGKPVNPLQVLPQR